MQSAAASDDIIDSLVNLLTQQIETEWKYKHLPKGIQKAFPKARQSPVERILLDHGGVQTWVAYFRATYLNYDFKGRKEQDDIIAKLPRLSADDQKRVAECVKVKREHHSITELIRLLGTTPKRRRALRLDLENARLADVRRIEVTGSASQQGIADVFSENAVDAIKGNFIECDGKPYLKDAITMVWTYNAIKDCIMTLTIHGSKMKGLVMALLDVQYSILSDQVTKTPPSRLDLSKNVSKEVIRAVFGSQIYEAYAASQTGTVSIEIPANPTHPGFVKLTLEPRIALRIQNIIFPK